MADGVASFLASPYRVWQEGREERALDKQVAEAGLPAVELSEEQARAMGYEDLNALRRARLASGKQWNIEENMQIAQQMSPIGRGSVDISRVRYTPEDPRLPGFLRAAEYSPMGDRITMFGTDNPLPLSTLAHEFTHRAHLGKGQYLSKNIFSPLEQKLWDSFPKNLQSGAFPSITNYSNLARLKGAGGFVGPQLEMARKSVASEVLTRFYDAWRANSPEAWRKAVRVWNDTYPIQGWRGQRGFQQQADRLEKLLDENRETLLALEAEAEAQVHRRHFAVLEERGLPYTLPTEEEWAQMRTRDLEQRSKAADSRAAARRPRGNAQGGPVYA